MGRVFIGIVCLVQIDLKRLVAYSSVVHINITVIKWYIMFRSFESLNIKEAISSRYLISARMTLA